jgi:hypothetical protein
MGDPLLFCFTRPDVESGNITPFLRRFGKDKLPRDKKLRKLMGTFSFFVDGYNDSPEELYAIQEVRDFYIKLHAHWRYWFFFADLENESLKIITACLMKNVSARNVIGESTANMLLDPLELLQFISAGFNPMNELCERANLSEFDIWKKTKAIFEYYGLPFGEPPLQ